MAEKKRDPGPSVKDDELYEKLRDEGKLEGEVRADRQCRGQQFPVGRGPQRRQIRFL